MPTTSRTHLFAGSLITWHTTAEDTGGAYSMAEAYVPAGTEAAADELPGPPAGPPPAEAAAAMTSAFGERGIEFTGPPLAVLLSA